MGIYPLLPALKPEVEVARHETTPAARILVQETQAAPSPKPARYGSTIPEIVTVSNPADMGHGDAGVLTIGCDDPAAARVAIDGRPILQSVEQLAGGLRILLSSNDDFEHTAAELNRVLVQAGVAVHRLELGRVSLEQRFLEITSQLGQGL